MTREEIEQETAHAACRLRQHLEGAQSGIWARIDQGRGETDYVHLYVVNPAGYLDDITYFAARASGDRSSLKRGWGFGGAQYNKRLQAVDAAYRAAGLPHTQTVHFHEFS